MKIGKSLNSSFLLLFSFFASSFLIAALAPSLLLPLCSFSVPPSYPPCMVVSSSSSLDRALHPLLLRARTLTWHKLLLLFLTLFLLMNLLLPLTKILFMNFFLFQNLLLLVNLILPGGDDTSKWVYDQRGYFVWFSSCYSSYQVGAVGSEVGELGLKGYVA